eukprot:3577248-Prymnesium_polylepis.1
MGDPRMSMPYTWCSVTCLTFWKLLVVLDAISRRNCSTRCSRQSIVLLLGWRKCSRWDRSSGFRFQIGFRSVQRFQVPDRFQIGPA